MCENTTGKDTGNEQNKKWEMVSTAHKRQIVPGLFLGNAKASYNQAMLQENHINAIVSLTDAWIAEAPSSYCNRREIL
ncbi:hypothetical protein BDW59DRAFT_149095 [Aspergillus cavernicola]|uniref:Uncharacterized protein n=1 Tax=Aspergillus cavernicola TaxID=176166 RepID=A0ABR4I635_9EURO